MHTSSKLACVVLLLVLGVSFGFGWGSLTHVYFANHLGSNVGALNSNEIYGAVLPDLFGYDFTVPGFTADYALHTSPEVMWSLYFSAKGTHAKAGFYGAFTHNNFNDALFENMRGADWFAHGIYPLPGESPDFVDGWVIQQGMTLVSDPSITAYLETLIPPETPGYPQNLEYFSLLVGHTLIETAGDILVKMMDNQMGPQLTAAARNRSGEIQSVLAKVVSRIPDAPTAQRVIATEHAFRQQMIGYGRIFTLPPDQLIAVIAQQTAILGQTFLRDAFGINPPPPIDPAKIAEFIGMAIEQIQYSFPVEVASTLASLEINAQYWPPIAGPPYALGKEGMGQETVAEFSLDQNYPNPFNPTTSIAYAVPSDSRVTLKVYNSIGQEVATLVNDNLTAGRYVATWDAEGVASGTYFYRIQAGNTVITKKMTLLR